jgi:DNA-binding beta-propeller fold protein YncE
MTWRRVAVVMLLSLCAARARAGQTSSIALSPDESTVAAVAQDADGVSLWHWPGDGPPRLVSVGQEPRTATFTPDGRALWVTCQTSQTLEAVDVKEGKTAARIPIDGQPYGVVLTADGRRAFVSQYAGGYIDGHYHPGIVAVVDLETRRTVARIPVKARP